MVVIVGQVRVRERGWWGMLRVKWEVDERTGRRKRGRKRESGKGAQRIERWNAGQIKRG